MRAKGYGAYRGRAGWKTILKVGGVALAILLILLAVLMGHLQRYVIVTGDGVRLDLPAFREDEVQSVDPSPVPPFIKEPVIVVTPEPTPALLVPEPVSVPVEALCDGSAGVLVEAGGGNAALVDMKTDGGFLAYDTQMKPAHGTGLETDDPVRNEAIVNYNNGENYAIARVSCFRDGGVTDYDRSFAILTNSGYRWTDPEEIHWTSPTSAAVREYLVGVCVELAQLGFDEIMLEYAGYPDQGNLHYIKKGDAYNSAAFFDVIGMFYQQVAQELEPYGTKLSVVATEEAVAGEDPLTGQSMELLQLWADRVWVREDDGTLTLVKSK